MRIDRLKLITEMARRRITVIDLAARAGLSRATVTAVRCGKSCSEETARKLVSVLGARIADREED